MKHIIYLIPAVCLVSLALSSPSAHATSLSLAPYVGQTISMTVEPYASGENNGSYYVGLTQINLATTQGAAIGSFEAFCDDFNHDIPVPDTYNVIVTAINSAEPALEQAAYYGTMFGNTPSGNSAMDTDIQELIWNLTAPSDKQFGLNSEMTTLQSQMLANYGSANYSNAFYLDATAAGDSGQSFMIAPTPEPPTLLTLATGLIGLAFFARRRLSQS